MAYCKGNGGPHGGARDGAAQRAGATSERAQRIFESSVERITMILQRFYDDKLAQASYLIGCSA
ncbi:MAG: hypothetical protein ACREKM_05965, partial [Longimicrobiales bacterium]